MTQQQQRALKEAQDINPKQAYWDCREYDHWTFDADCPPPPPTYAERIAAEYYSWAEAVAEDGDRLYENE